MAENPAGQSSFDTGGGPAVGAQGPLNIGGKNQFQTDVRRINELNTAMTSLNSQMKSFKEHLPTIVSQTSKWADNMTRLSKAMGGMGGMGLGGPGGGKGYIKDSGSLTQSVLGGGNTFVFSDRSQTANVYGAGGGGGGRGGGGDGNQYSKTALIESAITSVVNSLVGALNNRITQNSGYSLSANRMDVLYQQMTGMSGQGVRNAYRQPLQQYRLGPGGINQLLQLQATTGINAGMQGQSVEALRAVSGYAYTTEQINQMTRTLASPEVANRMFMMGGIGMYGIGGKQNSTMDVVKGVVRRLGLSDENKLRGALQPGSATREQMRQMGLPEDMQDMVLQYARENMTYKKKGGAGMYDPSNKATRKFMGIEGSYAAQYEETERTKVNREESMYNKQADSYAAMEKQMQSLTRTMQKLEESMAGLIGLKIRNRAFGQAAKGVAGTAGTLIGGAIGAFGGAPGITAGAMLGGALGNLIGGFLGDATGEKETGAKKVSTTAGSAAVNKGNIARSQSQLQKLHPKMRERIEKMMAANPNLYIGGGVRSTDQQKAMFLDRYRPTDKKTDVFWKGQYWERVKGAAAAPPGMSMHEIGLAVDLAPASEFDWVKKNAKNFGLRSFFDVNDEPWHVQPSELPASRMKYEQAGAPWGHNGVVSDPTDTNAIINGLAGMEHTAISSLAGAGGKGVNLAIQNYSGLSMGETINAMALDMQGSGAGTTETTGNTSGSTTNTASSKARGSRILTGREVAEIFYKAGFRGKNLAKAVAIAQRESHFNVNALNEGSRDSSYGLMQINMKGGMGPKRLKDFHLSKYEDLYDPALNAKAAYSLSGGGQHFDHWKLGPNKDPLYKTNLKAAEGFVKQAGYSTTGDPVSGYMPTPRGGAQMILQGGGGGNSYTVTIAPTIQLVGGNNPSADVERMAREITKLLDREVRMTLLRTS